MTRQVNSICDGAEYRRSRGLPLPEDWAEILTATKCSETKSSCGFWLRLWWRRSRPWVWVPCHRRAMFNDAFANIGQRCRLIVNRLCGVLLTRLIRLRISGTFAFESGESDKHLSKRYVLIIHSHSTYATCSAEVVFAASCWRAQ